MSTFARPTKASSTAGSAVVEVSPAESALEREADRVAGHLTGAPSSSSAGGDDPPADENGLFTESEGPRGPTTAEQIRAARAGGAPLPAAARQFFEPRLGVELGQVRVHADAAADQLSRSLSARAVTAGPDIFFADGELHPDTEDGRGLLAHELTHVVQQDPRGFHPKSLTVQRKPRAGGKKGSVTSDRVSFTVFIPREYTDMQQAYRLFERTAHGRETNSGWSCGDQTFCDITKIRGTQVPFTAVRDTVEGLSDPDQVERRKETKKELSGMGRAEQQAITDEVSKRYSQATTGKAGKRVAPKGEGPALQWDQALDEVMSQGHELESLPPAVKDLLVGKTAMAPKDYERLLKIAGKLATLSAEDLAAYRWLPVRATDNLDLFEKSVDLFIARKAEVVQAMRTSKGQTESAEPAEPAQKKDDLQSTLDEQWKDVDEKSVATMSESERYALARRKTDEMTRAQLTYMKDHPGETLKDMAKSAALLNTPETFEGIGKDLSEAADGDANTWARFAAGSGAGAKLSGWVLALAGVLYVASWLTGIGELATIGAIAGYALAATITLSAVESDLRVKAASQAKDPAEFKRQIQLAAAARANVIVSVAMIVIAATLHFVGKTMFPKTVARMRTSMLNFRERIRIRGSIYEIKPTLKGEMAGHRADVIGACAGARQQAQTMAGEVAGMDINRLADRLESGNGDFLDQTKARPDQRVNYRELTRYPEGRAALEEYRQALMESLSKDVPAAIDKLQQDYVGKIDEFVGEVDAAQNHEQLGAAANAFEPTLGDEHMKSLMSGEQNRLTTQKLGEASDALGKKAAQLKQVKPEMPPPVADTPPPSTPRPAPTAVPPVPLPPRAVIPDALPPKAVLPHTLPPKAPPASTPEPPQPELPRTAPPKSLPPETVLPETVPPQTVPPQTVPPQTVRPTEPPMAPETPEGPSTAPAVDASVQAIKAELSQKIGVTQTELDPLLRQRSQLSELNHKARAADDAVNQLDRNISRAGRGTPERTALEGQHREAVRARKAAADELRTFRGEHDLSKDSDLDFQISALQKDLSELHNALNPKPSMGVDETQPLGGRWYDVEPQGGEVNHMPADAANPNLSAGKGPSIRMDILDHYATNSWGSSKASVKWRAQQARLISEGKFLEALEMDVHDVRSKFGSKYEKGIQQMLDYVQQSPEVRALSPNSTVTVPDLRTPTPEAVVAP